ncbi:MAG TPA: hypothetical protein VGA55_07710 [Bacteroidota bacterium]
MSIYTALGFDEPTIAYCALHQVRKGIAPEAYRQTMTDFHKLLRDETAKINAVWETFRNEAMARSLQSARSHLMQYLSTPLRSDAGEIQRILRERIEEYSNAALPKSPLGMLLTSEGRVIDPPVNNESKSLAASGKRYLTELGFSTGRPQREIYESVFVVSGGQNLDVIEHLVRDRIGIYTPVHGKHIGEFDSYSYGAHNLVLLLGPLAAKDAAFEVGVFFSKGGVKYDLFRSTLKELLEAVQAEWNLSHLSLWQRKLGLGAGREFVLRIQGAELPRLLQALRALQTRAGQPFMKQPLKAAHVLCKEVIHQ